MTMNPLDKLRQIDPALVVKEALKLPRAFHSEFLRTGRILRGSDRWDATEKRYLTQEEILERTGRQLETAAEKTLERLNGYHWAIQYPKLIFHRTLENRPLYGYCHVTAGKSDLPTGETVKWAFYLANFHADIDAELKFIGKVSREINRMYFAIAVTNAEERSPKMVVDRSLKPDGILFRTHDPKAALKNILLLGTDNPRLRARILRL